MLSPRTPQRAFGSEDPRPPSRVLSLGGQIFVIDVINNASIGTERGGERGGRESLSRTFDVRRGGLLVLTNLTNTNARRQTEGERERSIQEGGGELRGCER